MVFDFLGWGWDGGWDAGRGRSMDVAGSVRAGGKRMFAGWWPAACSTETEAGSEGFQRVLRCLRCEHGCHGEQ